MQDQVYIRQEHLVYYILCTKSYNPIDITLTLYKVSVTEKHMAVFSYHRNYFYA